MFTLQSGPVRGSLRFQTGGIVAMRKTMTVVLAVATLAAPSLTYAASPAKAPAHKQGQLGTITGDAKNASNQALSNYKIRVRAKNGTTAAETTSNTAGHFTVSGLPADDYTVEILDAAGNVVGVSPVMTLAAGATMSITVTAAAIGAISTAAAGGFSLFGLGTTSSVLLLGGMATLATVGIVQATNSSSPSR
jgi:hypothetical protein